MYMVRQNLPLKQKKHRMNVKCILTKVLAGGKFQSQPSMNYARVSGIPSKFGKIGWSHSRPASGKHTTGAVVGRVGVGRAGCGAIGQAGGTRKDGRAGRQSRAGAGRKWDGE
jgi:hypothetical protein